MNFKQFWALAVIAQPNTDTPEGIKELMKACKIVLPQYTSHQIREMSLPEVIAKIIERIPALQQELLHTKMELDEMSAFEEIKKMFQAVSKPDQSENKDG